LIRFTVLFSILYQLALFPQGTILNKNFFSPALNQNRSLKIYLPEGYDSLRTPGYPVIYFLHGGNGYGGYPYIYNALDTLIGGGYIDPVILIEPNGSGGFYGAGYYTNSVLNGNFEDFGAYDLVNYIDVTYNTIEDKNGKGIVGHSWGAYSAMRLAIKHPDIFGSVASLSGTPDLNIGVELWRPYVLNENGGSPPYSFNPYAGVFSISMFGWAGAFSPNMGKPPYYVDFPLDSNGQIVDLVMQSWQDDNPAYLVSQLTLMNELAIYFDCGTSDEFQCYQMNTAFKDSLDLLGISYEFQSYLGGHFNKINERVPIAILFLSSNMVLSEAESLVFNKRSDVFILHQNYPNPFNPSTKINFAVPQSSNVIIKVFDILGKEVETIINEEKPAGSYEVKFDATGLTSGVYFYQIKSGDYIETKKMILMK
jgi:enterochelin esterase-like enzyme